MHCTLKPKTFSNLQRSVTTIYLIRIKQSIKGVQRFQTVDNSRNLRIRNTSVLVKGFISSLPKSSSLESERQDKVINILKGLILQISRM